MLTVSFHDRPGSDIPAILRDVAALIETGARDGDIVENGAEIGCWLLTDPDRELAFLVYPNGPDSPFGPRRVRGSELRRHNDDLRQWSAMCLTKGQPGEVFNGTDYDVIFDGGPF